MDNDRLDTILMNDENYDVGDIISLADIEEYEQHLFGSLNNDHENTSFDFLKPGAYNETENYDSRDSMLEAEVLIHLYGSDNNDDQNMLLDFSEPGAYDDNGNWIGDVNVPLSDQVVSGDSERGETSMENENTSYTTEMLNTGFGGDNVTGRVNENTAYTTEMLRSGSGGDSQRCEIERVNENTDNTTEMLNLGIGGNNEWCETGTEMLDSGFGGDNERRETGRANENKADSTMEMLYWGFGEPMELISEIPINCTVCQFLRKIVYTKEGHFTKLELHGRIGFINHVILESRYDDTNEGPVQYQMFDFSQKSIETVRDLLVQYCEDRKQADYSIRPDHEIETFYVTLHFGISSRDNDNTFIGEFDAIFGTPPFRSAPPSTLPCYYKTAAAELGIILAGCRNSTNTSDTSRSQHVNQVGPETAVRNRPESVLSAQSDSVAPLTLKDFAACCRMNKNKAAEKMGVSVYDLSKIMSKHGLEKWPYLEIKKLENQISKKRKRLNTCDEEGTKRELLKDLQALENQLFPHLAAFNQPEIQRRT